MPNVPDSTVTADQLKVRISARTEAEAEELHTLATETVADAFRNAWRDVPVAQIDECVYRVGRALKDTGKSSTGGGQLSATEGPSLRAPADPLTSSYPIIRRYVVLGL